MHRDKEKCYSTGLAVMRKIMETFPELEMHLDEDHEHVDIAVEIPKQKRLLFAIYLNLQNIDELHLCVGGFWDSWFPCTEEDRSDQFFMAVSGLIRGQIRVIEKIRRGEVVKANLQYQKEGNWETISNGTITFKWPKFGRTTFNILHNDFGA